MGDYVRRAGVALMAVLALISEPAKGAHGETAVALRLVAGGRRVLVRRFSGHLNVFGLPAFDLAIRWQRSEH